MKEKKIWERKCPNCGEDIHYKYYSSKYTADKHNSICKKCLGLSRRRKDPYTRDCPMCNICIVYNSKRRYYDSKKHNRCCVSCGNKKRASMRRGKPGNRKGCKLSQEHVDAIRRHLKGRRVGSKHPMWGKTHSNDLKKKWSLERRGKNNGMFGKKHTLETRRKISNARKGKPGPKITDDGLRRLRIKRILEIEQDKYNGHPIIPSFNKKSCKFFKKLNDILDWKGVFATKGGEYQIKDLGYFVDYYEPNINLVIEWDEKRHYDVDGNLKQNDVARMNEIKHKLNCKFIRIKETDVKSENELINGIFNEYKNN